MNVSESIHQARGSLSSNTGVGELAPDKVHFMSKFIRKGKEGCCMFTRQDQSVLVLGAFQLPERVTAL